MREWWWVVAFRSVCEDARKREKKEKRIAPRWLRRAINNEYEARSTKRGHQTTQSLRRICLCGHPFLSLISAIVTLSSFLSTSAPPAHEHEHEHEHNDKGTPAKHLFWASIGGVPLCFSMSNRLPALCTCEETGHKHSKKKQGGDGSERWRINNTSDNFPSQPFLAD